MLKVNPGIVAEKWTSEAIYFGDPSRSPKLTEDVFCNTAASAYSLSRVLIGSRRAEVGRKRNRKAHAFWPKNRISPGIISQGHSDTCLLCLIPPFFGKPRSNTNLPTRHGKQRFYWPWRRGPPWITRYEVYGNR